MAIQIFRWSVIVEVMSRRATNNMMFASRHCEFESSALIKIDIVLKHTKECDTTERKFDHSFRIRDDCKQATELLITLCIKKTKFSSNSKPISRYFSIFTKNPRTYIFTQNRQSISSPAKFNFHLTFGIQTRRRSGPFLCYCTWGLQCTLVRVSPRFGLLHLNTISMVSS